MNTEEALVYKPWKPTVHPRLSNPFKRRFYRENWSGKKWKDIRSIFDVIRDGDMLLHHPYQSFTTSTQRFVEEAARVRCPFVPFLQRAALCQGGCPPYRGPSAANRQGGGVCCRTLRW